MARQIGTPEEVTVPGFAYKQADPGYNLCRTIAIFSNEKMSQLAAGQWQKPLCGKCRQEKGGDKQNVNRRQTLCHNSKDKEQDEKYQGNVKDRTNFH
jgi:hypothetical protein